MKTVVLHRKKAAGRVALVDDEDYELVTRYRWHVLELQNPGCRPVGPYAVTQITQGGRRVELFMHTLITGYPMTDHIDHNGLNNVRSNLRSATASQNNYNSRPQVGTSSQYKGVHWASRDRRWRAGIKHGGKSRYLGTFWTEKDAALAYDTAAREFFGEYALLNFPEIKEEMKAERREIIRKPRRRRAASGAPLGAGGAAEPPATRGARRRKFAAGQADLKPAATMRTSAQTGSKTAPI